MAVLRDRTRLKGKDFTLLQLPQAPKPKTVPVGDHVCAHPNCFREAHFGFHVKNLRGQPGTWFCREHKDDGEPQAN